MRFGRAATPPHDLDVQVSARSATLRSRAGLNSGAAPRRNCSGNVLLEPAHEVLSDFSAVLFGHHLMAIAGQPDIFEVHVRSLYACLIEPLGCAMGVRTVIARLSRYIENPDTLHVYELVRGLLLNPARDEARPIRLLIE